MSRLYVQKHSGKYHKKINFLSITTWTVAASTLAVGGFLVFTTAPLSLDNASAATSDLKTDVTVPLVLSLAIKDLSDVDINKVSTHLDVNESGLTNVAKVIAHTNAPLGYTLTLADSDNITALAPYDSSTGTYDVTGAKIDPIASTGTTLANFSPDTWGYGVVYSNTDTDSPTPPTTFDPITTSPVTLSTEVEGPGTGYHYFTAAAKIGYATPADTYKDELTFSLTAVEPPAPWTPSYTITDVQPNTYIDPNGGEIITIITDATAIDFITVSSVTVGGTACTNPTVTTSPYGTGSTNYRVIVCTAPAKSAGTYDVSANITDTTTGNPATLTKANAVEYATVQFGGISSMQDMTASVCNAVSTGTTGALKDTRDNQIYRVFKALDGNCWMSENLRYGAMPETADFPTARPYDSSDTSKSDNMNTTNMANLTTSRICTTSSGCRTADGRYNMFSYSGDNYTMPYIMIYQANTAATYDVKTRYGVLYNYCAVTGGTVCNDSAMSTDAPGSVCPKGWKLPGMTASATGTGAVTDGSVKTYNNLANSYGYDDTQAGMNGMFSSPIDLLRAGYASYGSFDRRSATGGGYCWSSTKYAHANSVYSLDLNDISGSYVSQSLNGRYLGFSARCVSE